MRQVFLITALFCTVKPAIAYLDTSPKDFKKPAPLKTQAYKYQESQYDKVMESAADKVAPKVFGTLFTGPTGTIIDLADKWAEHQEKKDLKYLDQARLDQ